jgi:hypothetical protein
VTVIGVAADGFVGLQFDGTTDIIAPFAVMRAAGGGPAGPMRPFRSANVVQSDATRSNHRRKRCQVAEVARKHAELQPDLVSPADGRWRLGLPGRREGATREKCRRTAGGGGFGVRNSGLRDGRHEVRTRRPEHSSRTEPSGVGCGRSSEAKSEMSVYD